MTLFVAHSNSVSYPSFGLSSQAIAVLTFLLACGILSGWSNVQVSAQEPTPADFQPVERTFTVMPDRPTAEAAESYSATVYHLESMSNDPIRSLANPSVLKDLELVPSQISRIRLIERKYQPGIVELTRLAMLAGGDRQKLEALSERLTKLYQEKSAALESVLLPHQRKRLEQVTEQISLKARGIAGALRGGPLAKKLGVTEAQRKEISEIQEQLNRDIAESTQKLRSAAKQKVLDLLTPSQRERYEDLIGEDYHERLQDFPSPINRSPNGTAVKK